MCDSGNELNVNATSICGIVYELSRLAHDRQQMEHEDQEGKYHRIIQQQAQQCEYLKAELYSKDQMIEDLQRQITKSKKTAVYMKEKFRELRSYYEKSITAGDGAFIPTPLTAPSPPSKLTKHTEIDDPLTSSLSSSKTSTSTKELTNIEPYQQSERANRHQGRVSLMNKSHIGRSSKKSPPSGKKNSPSKYNPIYCLTTVPVSPSFLPSSSSSSSESKSNNLHEIEGRKENLLDLDVDDLSVRGDSSLHKMKTSTSLSKVKRSRDEDQSAGFSSKLHRSYTTNYHICENVRDVKDGDNDDNKEKQSSLKKYKSICLGDTRRRNNNDDDITRKPEKTNKYVEVVRKKADREILPGHTCEECENYYRALQQVGMYNSPNSKAEMLQRCSRHKHKYTPPCTPDSFWDLTIKDNYSQKI